MQLVVGTYERYLLGYRLPDDVQAACELQRSFTHAAHQGPVRCLDAAGSYVVSGGQDDQLHIYDIKQNKDLGFMMNPGDGAIPCLQLYTPANAINPTHLFSGSDDGSIAVWKVGGSWEHLKLMRGHKGPVRSLSVHPTGRLALSVGHDRALRMWHLAKGRCSYTAKLDTEADHICFSPNGEVYALLCDKLVMLHSAGGEGQVLARLPCSRRCCCLLQNPDGNTLMTGLDDGRLAVWDLRQQPQQQPLWEVEKAHNSRIRAIVAVTPDVTGGLPRHLATASSDGIVKLWDSRMLGKGGSSSSGSPNEPLGVVSTRGRITGMVLSSPDRHAPGAGAGAAAAIGAGGDGTAAAAAAFNGVGTNYQLKRKKRQKQQQPAAKQQAQQQPLQQGPTQQQRQQRQQQQQQQDAQGSNAGKVQKQHKSGQKSTELSAQRRSAETLVPEVRTKIVKKQILKKKLRA